MNPTHFKQTAHGLIYIPTIERLFPISHEQVKANYADYTRQPEQQQRIGKGATYPALYGQDDLTSPGYSVVGPGSVAIGRIVIDPLARPVVVLWADRNGIVNSATVAADGAVHFRPAAA